MVICQCSYDQPHLHLIEVRNILRELLFNGILVVPFLEESLEYCDKCFEKCYHSFHKHLIMGL